MENNESFSGCEFQDPIFVWFRPLAFQAIEMDCFAKPPTGVTLFFGAEMKDFQEKCCEKMLC